MRSCEVSTMAVTKCSFYFVFVYWNIILNVPVMHGQICSPHPMRFTNAVKFCQEHNGTLSYDLEKLKTCQHSTLDIWSGYYSELTSWFSIQGCFRVNITEPDDVTLDSVEPPGSNNSLITCYNACKRQDQQHVYFYLRGEACLCSYSLSKKETVDDRLCNTKCDGDVTDFCGASSDLYTVYKEEDTLEFNNNKDHLCMYQRCVPSPALESGNCDALLRSICGEHVSDGNSTWSESVNNCFSSRGLYLKSDKDCKIGNSEGLWLGVFRKHVVYIASDRLPLPRKPLTGCSVIYDNGVTTFSDCLEKRPFVCFLDSSEDKENCSASDTDKHTPTTHGTVTRNLSGASNVTQSHNNLEPILYIAISSVCLISVVSLFSVFCLNRMLLSKQNKMLNANKKVTLKQDTEMKMLVSPTDNTSPWEEPKYYCIYSLQKIVSQSPVGQSTTSNTQQEGICVNVSPKSHENENTAEDVSLNGESELKGLGEKSVYDLNVNVNASEKNQDELFPQNETSGKQSVDKFVYDLAINHIVSDNVSFGKETKFNENGEKFANGVTCNNDSDCVSKLADECPYQEINFEDYDILHKPRLKHCDDQDDTNGSYDQLPRRHKEELNDIIHSHDLQEF